MRDKARRSTRERGATGSVTAGGMRSDHVEVTPRGVIIRVTPRKGWRRVFGPHVEVLGRSGELAAQEREPGPGDEVR